MHATWEHGGLVVEALQEMEYNVYGHGFFWNLTTFQRQVRVLLFRLSGPVLLELRSGERGELAAGWECCQTGKVIHITRLSAGCPEWRCQIPSYCFSSVAFVTFSGSVVAISSVICFLGFVRVSYVNSNLLQWISSVYFTGIEGLNITTRFKITCLGFLPAIYLIVI